MIVLGPFANNDEPALRRSVFSNTISFLEKVFSTSPNITISNVNGVNIGLIVNGASPRVVFKLGAISTLQRLKDALRRLSLPYADTNGETIDMKRLSYLVKYQFSQNGGVSSGREGVPKVMFYITSGTDIDDVNDSADVIKNLKEEEGVKVVTVTIGSDLDGKKYGDDLADSEKSLFIVKDEEDRDLLLDVYEDVQKEILEPSKGFSL